MPYTHTTFGQMKAALALRLHDSANVHWADAELGQYIVEALRTWQAYSAFFRERMPPFATVAGTVFYDLGTVAGTLLGRTVTDQSLISTIEYHLLEPQNLVAWSGTEQFTYADVTEAITRRRNQFLLETGAVQTHSTQVVAPTINGRYALDDDVVDVRRAAFLDVDGIYTHLWREDEWAANSLLVGWSLTPAAPVAYSVAIVPPVTIQLIPPPNDVGTLDLVTIDATPALDPASGATALGIQDDYCWTVKWGALADLLGRDGPGSDPQRSQYCEQRWQEGVALARIMAVVTNAQINGVPVFIESLYGLDTMRPAWQSNAQTTPDTVAMAGNNLLVLADPPDGAHSITLDVVRNFPVPTADADPITVGREQLDAILDYAEHLAAFKMGGAEFQATVPHYQRLIQLASVHNDRLKAQDEFKDVLEDRTLREGYERPRRQSDTEAVRG